MVCFLSVLQVKNKAQRVKTIYDCQADNEDELTFVEGEVIVVTGEEDQEWWVGTRTTSCMFMFRCLEVLKDCDRKEVKTMGAL